MEKQVDPIDTHSLKIDTDCTKGQVRQIFEPHRQRLYVLMKQSTPTQRMTPLIWNDGSMSPQPLRSHEIFASAEAKFSDSCIHIKICNIGWRT